MAQGDSDKAFVSGGRLYTIVPETSNSSFSDFFTSARQDDEVDDALPLPIKERNVLFFDERLIVYIILRTTHSSEQSLKQYLPRLQIKLDVWAINDSDKESKSGSKADGSVPERDLVFSDTLKDVDDPFIVLNAEDEEDPGKEPVVLAVWQTEATLNRPRARFMNPALTFLASANLLPSKTGSDDFTQDEYLSSFTPAPANVFESLKQIPALKDDPPYLPVSRLERVLPDASLDGGIIKIRPAPARSFSVIQAMSARIRYSRLETSSNQASIVASLDLEVTRFINQTVELEAADVKLAHGSAEVLMPQQLPISCRPRDVVTFMYRLHPAYNFETPSLLPPATAPTGNSSTGDIISISTLATISVSDSCRARIAMAWSTNIDLSAPLNPNFGPPSQSLQRANRPQSLPVAAGASLTNPVALKNTPRTSVLGKNGLTISLSGPVTPVELGRTFVWKVLVVNQGPKIAKLAIIPLPQIPRSSNQSQQLNRRHAPQKSVASTHQAEKRESSAGSSMDISPAICDENIVHALQHQPPHVSGTELVSLTPELRIGPLAPGTCHEDEIRLLALKQGSLRVEAVRVVDLVRENEEGSVAADFMTDIRDLPDVVAVKAKTAEGDNDPSINVHAQSENERRKSSL